MCVPFLTGKFQQLLKGRSILLQEAPDPVPSPGNLLKCSQKITGKHLELVPARISFKLWERRQPLPQITKRLFPGPAKAAKDRRDLAWEARTKDDWQFLSTGKRLCKTRPYLITLFPAGWTWDLCLHPKVPNDGRRGQILHKACMEGDLQTSMNFQVMPTHGSLAF